MDGNDEAAEEVRWLNAELEQQVTDLTAQLQAANKELEAFSNSVSHHVRVYLRIIGGFGEALVEDYAHRLDDQGKNYIALLCSTTRDMGHLIDNLSRLTCVTWTPMRRERFSLSALADRILSRLKEKEPERKVRVRIEKGLLAAGDQHLLGIMLENLLANAWKFTSRREIAEIEFGKQEHNGKTVYFIRDNGMGFDMTYASKLFVPFQRLHHPEFKGTGIGLASVQRIVHRHGGSVWAKGSTDEGATFYFTLPSA
jgi:light-regulated signal transduction histidine kinase (bacteriophytochrome)